MGGCFSSKPSSKFNNSVRLVHLSGYVEDFEEPISVKQVTGTPSKHFVCTSVQLLSSSSKPLNGDTQLQRGNVYFMLPYSILQTDVSPVNLASLAKRLTAIANTSKCEDKKSSLKDGPFSSHVWSSSPSRSPGRLEQIGRSPCRMQPWKPILDTIREKSFNKRSESDLQEYN
ncbi:uncharacterized protein LOC109804440 [Cajanus cajan]|uniref:DUF4228 domain protein n=1 Tax=Cajanus cajan TaxID=3821 RepID=A0A151T5G8_CAJCA|nr:uncharacterized protein LOC109804440 [Cajanus cajan]KYP62287.1 hypothetical protein KK1_016814 [Cajanus cajan]